MAQNRLGEFEELILLTVCTLTDDAYGVTIKATLHREANRTASVGAIYATLDRLERKGFVESWVGGATAVRGGRRKRYYRVTSSGLAVLAEVRRVREHLWRGLDDMGLAGMV